MVASVCRRVRFLFVIFHTPCLLVEIDRSHGQIVREHFLISELAVRRAVNQLALDHDFEPIGDMRSTADYRIRVAKNLLERLYLDLAGDAVR